MTQYYNATQQKVKWSPWVSITSSIRSVKAKIHAFLTLATVESELSDSCSGHLIPMLRAPGTHWLGG